MHFLGMALILLSWFAAAVLLIKWRNHDLATISKHAATSKKGIWLFLGVLVGLGAPFYYWMLAWFVPTLHLGSWFVTTLIVILCLQVTTALFPDTHGWHRTVHRAAAYSMAALYMPFGLQLVTASRISTSAKVLSGVCLAYMIGAALTCVIGVLYQTKLYKKAKQHYLLLQMGYIVAMQTMVLASAYIR